MYTLFFEFILGKYIKVPFEFIHLFLQNVNIHEKQIVHVNIHQ